MRILLVNSGLRYGGAETQLIRSAKGLVARGHQVSLYLLTKDAPRLREFERSGVEIVPGDKKSKLDMAALSHLRSHIRRWRPDVIKSYLFDANLYARVAAVGCGVKVVNGERSHGYRMAGTRRLMHLATRHLADAVIANTHAGGDFARQLFKLSPQKVHVLWNGIDLDEVRRTVGGQPRSYRERFGAGPDEKLLCVVGTLRPVKDLLLAVRTFGELRRRDPAWRMCIVGESIRPLAYKSVGDHEADYPSLVMKEIADQGLGEACRFLGERDDALQVIAASDVLLSTSVNEGFPNVVLEAMAAGTPAVSTDYSDIRRILPFEWQTASRRDPAVLADAVERALRERPEVVRAQTEFVQGHATMERMVTGLENLLSLYARH